MVVGRRRRGAPDRPIPEVGVGAIEQRLEAVELRRVEIVQACVGEPAEQQIGLARAAMPAPVAQALAANGVGFGHGDVPYKVSREDCQPSRGPLRPEILFPLFAPPTALPGVGPRLGKLVEALTGPHVADLLWHLPSGLVDRRFAPVIAEAPDGRIATIRVEVMAHQPGRSPRQPYKVIVGDATDSMELVFFHARPEQMERALPVGSTRLVSGKVERYHGRVQMAHPDRIVSPEEAESLIAVEPVYPLTAGLVPRVVQKAVKGALDRAPALPDWQDAAWLKRQGWPDWRTALAQAHAPQSEDDLASGTPARRRLAYDELLANQLALALVRADTRRKSGRAIAGDGRLRERLLAALPFQPTGAQIQAAAEIAADMARPQPMQRLLQGDVGSGKTLVALLAMLNAVESGAQAALMAPTAVLARQHLATIQPLGEAAGVRVAALTGRDKGKAREAVLAGLADGTIDIVVGTHALVQDDVAFRDLALVVIDEQHRFGVDQRLALAAKGRAVDLLAMTATPIPRTLMLAAHGDLDTSRLTEKPAGRQPIQTAALPIERLPDVLDAVARRIEEGGRVFWICPLVEESETADLAAATERHAQLAGRFGNRVGLVHGRMKAREKDAAMAAFSEGRTQILVATTVIEVGVDVPEASVMVIEHSERFGLAQLHQLRGRVGRGSAASSCLLVYQPPLGETARARLAILRETDDGFRIAEEDLRLRGAGEVLGTRQSGLPEFRLVDLEAHGDLVAVAQDDARLIIERDPALATLRGQALRVLLYLFARDAAVRYARTG